MFPRPGSAGTREQVMVKTWGKSPRFRRVTAGKGKPYMLKCHVYQRQPGRLARSSRLNRAERWVGRQHDPGSNAGAR
jgi:hypothetical protein